MLRLGNETLLLPEMRLDNCQIGFLCHSGIYTFLKKIYTLLYKEFKVGGDCKWKTDDMFIILEQITLKGVYFSFHKYLFVCFPKHYPRYLTHSG